MDASGRRRVAIGILAAGWAIAAAVYLTAAPVEEDPEIFDLQHSRIYERQLEVIGGKAAVLGSEIDAWIESLWQGQRRAYPVAAVALAVALGCWPWRRAAPSGG
jgi:hypothetical protein